MQTPETLVAQRRLARQARQRFVEDLCASLPDLHKTVGEFLSALMAQTGTQREMQTRRDAWLLYQQHQAAWLDGTAKAWRDAVLPASSAGPGGRAVNLSFELLSDDVVIILGFFAFFQWEFSLSVLAAVLAVLGYSVNESVVIFDRIREAFRKYRKMTTSEVIDHAITSTMSRTIITHASTEAMVLSMLFFGGPSLHYFAMALTIGILFGIYSSVFVAAAIAMWLGIKREDLIKTPATKKEGDPADPNAGASV